MIEKTSIENSKNINQFSLAQVPIEKQCWNADECASYLKMTKKTFLNYYAPHPKFPKAIRPQRMGGNGLPLWKATEVIDWLFKQS